MAYADLKEYGTEVAVKAAGKLMQKGKPYEVVDGDIIQSVLPLRPRAQPFVCRLLTSACACRAAGSTTPDLGDVGNVQWDGLGKA